MRVSSNQYQNTALSGIISAYQRMGDASSKLSTGKQIGTPSDDPSGTAQALTIQNHLDNLDQTKRTLNSAKSILAASDAALESVSDILRQGRTLAVQGGSTNITAEERASLAQQVTSLIQTLGNQGNASLGNRYLFAGQRNDKAPFQANQGSFTYQGGLAGGADGDIRLDISTQESLIVNTTGDRAIVPALKALEQLRDNLSNGNIDATSTESIKQFDTEIQNLSTIRAGIGSKINNVDRILNQNTTIKVNFTQALSDIEDTDIPKTVVQYQSAQLAYQAALQSTSRIGQLSLLDFLK